MERLSLDQKVPAQVLQLFKRIGALSCQLGFRSFLVGGFVRDLVMNQRAREADIAVEGDALRLVRVVCREGGWSVTVHHRFLTATARPKDPTFPLSRLDFVTARREDYRRPGALPQVTPATIREDLSRRDFTINAIALSLMPDDFGSLLDPLGGLSDIDHKVIRILHPLSFRDDPTRILRAVRYEQRFSFRIDRQTLSCLRKALTQGCFSTVSGQRIKGELIKIFHEPGPHKILRRMKELGVLRAVAPQLDVSHRRLRAVQTLRKRLDAYHGWEPVREIEGPFLAVLVSSEDAAQRLQERFSLSSKWLANARQVLFIVASQPLFTPGEMVLRLNRLPVEMVLAVSSLRTDISYRRWKRYLYQWRWEKPDITPEELRAHGLDGKGIRLALTAALKAKLDERADRFLQWERALAAVQSPEEAR